MDMVRNWQRGAACEACEARPAAICASLAGDAFAALSRLGRKRRLARGQVLIWEGEENLFVGTLISGVLKLTAATSDGREQIVGLAWPSDFVGSPFARRTGFRVTALSDATLCLFDQGDFEAFVQHEPQLERDLLRRVTEDLDRARGLMLLLGRMTAEERLASLLVDMASRGPRGQQAGTQTLDLPLRRQELADVLGLTIETVSRQLRKLSDAGVISVPNRRTIVLENPAGLEAIAAA